MAVKNNNAFFGDSFLRHLIDDVLQLSGSTYNGSLCQSEAQLRLDIDYNLALIARTVAPQTFTRLSTQLENPQNDF